MSQFYEGCEVRVVSDRCYHNIPIGTMITLVRRDSEPNSWRQSFNGNYVLESDIELLNKSKSIMSIKESFLQAFLKEPEKSFRKAGITNGDGFLTADGQQVFLTWLLQQNADKFKTDVVDAILEDQEAK